LIDYVHKYRDKHSEHSRLVYENESQSWWPDEIYDNLTKYFGEKFYFELIKETDDILRERTYWKNELIEEEFLFSNLKKVTSVLDSNTEKNVQKETAILKEKVLSNIDKAFKNMEINKFLKYVENKDFSNLITIFQQLKISKDFDNVIHICDDLEETFNITRLGIKNSLQKIKIEDYQKEMFNIRKLTNDLKNSSDNEDLQNELNSSFDNMIRKLESRKALNEFLKELDTNEEELENEMTKTRTVF